MFFLALCHHRTFAVVFAISHPQSLFHDVLRFVCLSLFVACVPLLCCPCLFVLVSLFSVSACFSVLPQVFQLLNCSTLKANYRHISYLCSHPLMYCYAFFKLPCSMHHFLSCCGFRN